MGDLVCTGHSAGLVVPGDGASTLSPLLEGGAKWNRLMMMENWNSGKARE